MNAALKALQIKAREQVYTFLAGHNLSKLYGEGYDFAELREYQDGDDIRKINWTITAKLQKPYIKEFHSNRELSVAVCALMDASLYFGSGNTKQKRVAEVATILGYATLLNRDLFTGIVYTQNKQYSTMPSKQIYHIEQFSKNIFEADLLNTTLDYANVSKNLFKRIAKPSLVFIIGDFLEKVDFSILAQKHEVIVVIIRDKEEEFPKRLAEVSLKNPKKDESLETYFGAKSIVDYKAKLQEHDAHLNAHFARHNIRSIKILTNEEIVPKLMKLFI